MAAARGSKRSNRGANYRQRPVGTRPVLPVILLVFDDSKTAPMYFRLLKRKVKQHVTIEILPAPCKGASPRSVVDRAIEESKKREDNRESGDRIWAVYDLEREPHLRTEADEARDRAKRHGIHVAVSDPCYEIWTLLHLEDTGQAFENCERVVDQLKQQWKNEFGQSFDKKTKVDYSKIIHFRHDAASRAKPHWERGDPSRTEIYKILEDIDRNMPD